MKHDPSQAEALLRKAIAICEGNPDVPTNFSIVPVIGWARLLGRTNRAQEAERLLREVLCCRFWCSLFGIGDDYQMLNLSVVEFSRCAKRITLWTTLWLVELCGIFRWCSTALGNGKKLSRI